MAGNFNNLANIEQLFHLDTVKGLLGCRDKCGLFLDLEELTKEMRGTNKLYLGGGVVSVSRCFFLTGIMLLKGIPAKVSSSIHCLLERTTWSNGGTDADGEVTASQVHQQL